MIGLAHIPKASASARAEYRHFLATEKGSQLYRRFRNLLYGEEDALVTSIAERVMTGCLFRGRSDLTVSDVGCGDGERTSRFCQHLVSQGSYGRLCLIEQSPVYVRDLGRRVFPSGWTTSVYHQRFEEYTAQELSDLVLVVHSIFGMEELNLVEKIVALKTDDGVIVIASNASTSLLGRLKRVLDMEFACARLEVDGIECRLEQLSVDFRVERFFTTWSVETERVAEVECLLGDWLGLGRYGSLGARVRDEFVDLVRSSGAVRDGRIYWREEERVLVIGG